MSIYSVSASVHLTPHGFSTLAYKFPLKIMPAFSKPLSADRADSQGQQQGTAITQQDKRCHQSEVTAALAYILSFGGGLVGGDEVLLDIRVDPSCRLTLLTQGNTKVFKQRPARGKASQTTTQAMSCTIEPNASLILLPSPVTCFANASYSQFQRFNLVDSSSSNLILLDSITSGRASRGEVWQFASYYSLNEIWFADSDSRLVRDALLLQQPNLDSHKMVYDTYATLFLAGPRTKPLVDHYSSLHDSIFKRHRAPDFLWSLTVLEHGVTLVRAAGMSPEAVKDFYRDTLRAGGLEDWLGSDVFRQAWA